MTVSAIYRGEVTHRRLRPKVHALRYRIFQIYLDLDEAPQLSRTRRLFGFDRAALLSLHQKDHGDGSATPLKTQMERRVAAEGLAVGGPVRMLCLPRVLGFVFNPISLYFCHDASGALSAIVYEVNNTFGDRHCYVLPADAAARIRVQATRKALHVSPFMDMDHDYHFAVEEPGEGFTLRIQVRRGEEVWLTTGFSGRRAEFTDRELLGAWLSHPLVTLKVVAAIHWEALKIWRKGIGYRPRPHTARKPGAA